ncbi:MAG: SDR family oxidoreductase [Cyanobacteriota bacterium]|nr:SDR family oxidoreductase [Cyanobacteriota bacterium]
MINTKFDLRERTALVTGAAGLLGREHTAALLEIGANVCLTDKEPAGLETALEEAKKLSSASIVIARSMDVTDEQSIRSVLEELESESIAIDILINNAALNPKVSSNLDQNFSRLESFLIDQWNKELSVGLTGAFLCSKVFGTAMAASGKGGVILNISSDLSVIAPDQRLYAKKGVPDAQQPVKPVTYSVIKSGLVGLTKYLSTYWADRGVRCNALSPGGVYTDQPSEFVDRVCELIPMGRMAKPTEYRSAVQFLCSDASEYMNGQNIVIDGGRTAW